MAAVLPRPEIGEQAADTSEMEDYRVIFRREFGFICRSLRRLGVAPSDVEDLGHDVFLIAYQKRESYDPSKPFRLWLSGIALRVASNYRHRARTRRLREVPESDERAASAPSADKRADDELGGLEDRELLLAALNTLDVDRRAVLVMYELSEFSGPEVADLLGIPINTVYSRLRLAREDLREAVRRLLRQRGETR